MKYGIIDQPLPFEVSFWQSEIWKKILEKSRQAEEVFYFGDAEIYALIEIRTIGFRQRGAFILGCTAKQLGKKLDIFFSELTQILRGKNILFLQIEPMDEIEGLSAYTISSYKYFLTPHTRILDLLKPLDTLFSEMHEKGRYNIRGVEKRGVVVEKVPPSEENIDIFYNLLRETSSRDGFSENSRNYYKIFLEELETSKSGGLYLASLDGFFLAASIGVYTKERAIYYYGASTSNTERRKFMASYLLQWHMIRDGKNHGSAIYDFLGVADPANPRDPLKGVTQFKERFGGDTIVFPPKVIIPLSYKYYIFMFFYKLKNLL